MRIQDMLSEGDQTGGLKRISREHSSPPPSESMSDRILVQFTDRIYLTALEAFDVFDQAAEQLEEENDA